MKNSKYLYAILVATLTLIIVGAMSYSFYLGRSMAGRYAPLVTASLEIKQEATLAHLWFEELLGGDRQTAIEEVWGHLDRAEWYARAMLEGGENGEGVFVPLENNTLRQKIYEVVEGIRAFRSIARERWALQSQSGIGGADLERRFDKIFDTFFILADEVETALQQALKRQMQQFDVLQSALIPIIALSGLFVVVIFRRHRRLHMVDMQILQERGENLRVTLNSIGDAVIVTGADGTITHMNPIAEKLTGWKMGEADNRPLSDVFRIIHTNTRAPVVSPVQRVLENGIIVGLANHSLLIARDGKECQIADSAAPIRDAAGAITGVILIFRDVTEEYAMQRSVRESEVRFRNLFNNAEISIWNEDLSAVRKILDRLQQRGVMDLRQYLKDNPKAIWEMVESIRVLQVNGASVKLFGAGDEAELIDFAHKDARVGSTGLYRDIFCAIWEGEPVFRAEVEFQTLDYRDIHTIISLRIPETAEGFQSVPLTIFDITENKLIEAAMRAYEQRFKTFFSSVNDAIFVHPLKQDGFMPFIEVNSVACQHYGYGRDEFLKLTILDIVQKKNGQTPSVLTQRKQLLEQGSMVFESVHTRKSGETFPVEISSTIVEESGRPVVLSVVRDITERKRAEELLLEKDARFRKLFERTDAIAVQGYDRNRRVIYWNHASETLYGYSADDAIGRQLEDLIIPDEMREVVIAGTDAWMDGGREIPSAELVLRGADGSPVHVFSSHVMLRNSDNEPEMYCADVDLTQLKQAEEHVRTLSQAVEQSPVSVMITNTDGDIEYVNTTCEQVSGYRSNEMIGKNPRIQQSGNTSKGQYKELWQTISSGRSWQGEVQNRKKNGELYWEYLHVSPVLDEQGVIRHYLGIKEDISLRKQQEEQILYQAHFDALTGLPNRFLSLDRLSQLVHEAQRNKELVAVLFLDLDDFKKINDTMGHDAGDKVLTEAAVRLGSVVRRGDTVGRLGGDEFIILLGGLKDASDAQPVVENLLNRFRDSFSLDGREHTLTASLGISVFPHDGSAPSELLRNADTAMYHSKEQGRNTYSYFTDTMNLEVTRRLLLEEQMRGALERGEFRVCYQPLVDVESRRIIGAEALLRWSNPALGEVSPMEFIPVAEQTGLIIPIGEFVLTRSLDRAVKWQSENGQPFKMAVNLSPRQLQNSDLVSFIEETLRQLGCRGESLELEITEGVLMAESSNINETLLALNELDIGIAMDDFGTGYSSLSYLRKYPFDTLKIDRSFVNGITADSADLELVNATIVMAHGLGLKVVAEGVETSDQLALLDAQKCDFAQGYLFSKPVPAESFSEMLKAQG